MEVSWVGGIGHESVVASDQSRTGAVDRTRDWPLTGRSVELDLGARLLDRPGRSLVLSGAAGVGKSRLALELAERQAAAHDLVVVRVAASAALRTVPAGALAPLLRSAPTESTGDAGWPGAVETGSILTRLHDAVAARSAPEDPGAAERRAVVVVDDAHLLDDLSAAALRQLATAGSVRLVATVRSGEPTPDDVAALWRGAEGDRLELMPLSHHEVHSLVAAVLGTSLASESARRLAEISGGNCLALRELVLDGLASGRFAVSHGVARWEPAGAVGHRLVDLVDSWLGSLSDAEAELLLVVALAGAVPHAVLVGPDGWVSDQAARRAGQGALEDRGALTVDATSIVRLGHPLYGEVARTRATSVQIAAARRVLVAGFQRRLRDQGVLVDDPTSPGAGLLDAETATDLVRLAGWVLDEQAAGGGDVGDDRDVLSEDERTQVLASAAEQAMRFGDIDTAHTLASAAVASGSSTSLAVLADALVRRGRFDEAADVLARLWIEVERPSPAVVRRAVQSELTVHLLDRRDPGAARAAVDAALARVDAPDDAAFVHAAHASFLAMAGQLDEADDVVGDDDTTEPAVRLRALPGRVAVLVAAGRVDEAVTLADAALAEALMLTREVPEGLRWSVSALSLALLTGGHLERLAQLIDAGRSFETSDTEAAAYRGLIEGRAALFAGRAGEALSNLSDAVDWYERRGQRIRIRWLLALLAEAHLLAGDADTARKLGADASAATRAGNLTDLDADRAIAWVEAAASGGVRSADGMLTVADRSRDAGARPQELLALWEAFRLTSSKVARRRIQGLAPSVASPLAGLIGDTVRASSGAELEAAADAFADAGFLQWAAEVGQRAAEAHRTEGRRSAGVRADAAAEARWEACGRPCSPMLVVRGPADDLTAREAEVARLVAAGATSRRVADDLGVSVRTVDNLLGRVYVKLGIAGRGELADALGPDPVP